MPSNSDMDSPGLALFRGSILLATGAWVKNPIDESAMVVGLLWGGYLLYRQWKFR